MVWSSGLRRISSENLCAKPAIDDEEASFTLAKQKDVLESETLGFRQHPAQINQGLTRSYMRTHIPQTTCQQHSTSDEYPLDSDVSAESPKRLERQPSEHLSADDEDVSAVDIFYDCLSRFAADDSSSSGAHLYTKFQGSPDYYLELKSSFYPEQYSTESLFNDKIFVFAMIQSRKDHHRQKYFLMYAENPRRWQRITVSLNYGQVRGNIALLHMSANYKDCNCKLLPKLLQNLLDRTLPRLESSYTITNLSLSLQEDESGQMVFESSGIDVAEDTLEVRMCDGNQILYDVEHLDCPKFVESDVIVLSRMTTSCYHVMVGSRRYLEQKAPFAAVGWQDENGFDDFCRDMRLLHALRGCASVVQFIGIVLDQRGQQLKSYLYESPMIGSLLRLLRVANSRPERIPWPIREIWSRQIIKAVSDVHKKDHVFGLLEIRNVGLRADGTVALTGIKTGQRHLRNGLGDMPPELRKLFPRRNERATRNMSSFETDIFQLGMILWLLAEHRGCCTGYLCAKSACTTFPSYMCLLDHTNPVDLPACCNDIPPYFNDIISKCRLPNPKARPSACRLIETFPYTGEVQEVAPDITVFLERYEPQIAYFCPCCDECGGLAKDVRYHCNVCFEGDFDLCLTCVAQGVHCFVSQHRLVKRVFRNGRFVDES